MKKKEQEELKKMLKPLIRTCVKEIILNENILSKIVAEVAKGVVMAESAKYYQQPPVVFQQPATPHQPQPQAYQTAVAYNETMPTSNLPLQYQSQNNVNIGHLAKERQLRQQQAMSSIKNLNETAYNGVNIYGDIDTPMDTPPSPGEKQSQGPLDNYAPNDPGVNLDNLFGSMADNWSKMA